MYNRISKNLSQRFVSLSVSHCAYGEKDSIPINQNASKDFNIDPDTGRPMSQIQQLVKSQLAAEQMALFAELDEFKSNYLPKDMSDKEALKFLAPRWCQLPSQLSDFQSYIMAQRDIAEKNAADNAAAAAAVEKAAASAVETSVETKSD